MSRNRLVLVASSTAVIAVALIAATTMPNAWLRDAVFIVRAVFPSLIDWDDHDAFKKCAGAVERPAQWPAAQAQACNAMRMCANEAPLTNRQEQALYGQLRKLGCAEP